MLYDELSLRLYFPQWLW